MAREKYNILVCSYGRDDAANLLNKFVGDGFSASEIAGTTGAIVAKNKTINDVELVVTVDMQGSEQRRIPVKYISLDAAVFVIDLNDTCSAFVGDRGSFNHVTEHLFSQTKRLMNKGSSFVIAGLNKGGDRTVDDVAIRAFAEKHSAKYVEYSPENADKVFEAVVEEIQKSKAPAVTEPLPPVIDVIGAHTAKLSGSRRDGCCLVL